MHELTLDLLVVAPSGGRKSGLIFGDGRGNNIHTKHTTTNIYTTEWQGGPKRETYKHEHLVNVPKSKLPLPKVETSGLA